jgi:hypothetical protein
VADFGIRVRQLVGGYEAAVDRQPALAAVIAAEGTRGRDGDIKPVGVALILHDGVQTHPTGAWLPEVSFGGAQPRQLLPCLATVVGAEDGGVFDPRIDGVRVGQ